MFNKFTLFKSRKAKLLQLALFIGSFAGLNAQSYDQNGPSSVTENLRTCEPMSEFSENFDNVTGNNLPSCWQTIVESEIGTPSVELSPNGDMSRPNSVSFLGNAAATEDPATKMILVSPPIADINSRRLRFKARKSNYSDTPTETTIEIVVLDGNTADANMISVAHISDLEIDAKEFNVYFNNYEGSGNYIGIRRVGGPTFSFLYVDDIVIEAAPSCVGVTNIAASVITPLSANITWESNTIETFTYEYFVSTSNSAPTAEDEILTTSEAGVALTNLTASTTYYVFVRESCSETEKSVWNSMEFTTNMAQPVPWIENFETVGVDPEGWLTINWEIGEARGATGIGSTSTNIYKNLFITNYSPSFSTVAVGPLNADNYEFSFYYKQSNYEELEQGYEPIENWGKFDVEVSTNFGETWETLGTVDNEPGTGEYIQKIYSLASYQNQYVKFRIKATRSSGDYDLSFDQFEVKESEAVSACVPEFQYGSDGDMITQVILNTIDNESSFASNSTPTYEDFTTISTNLVLGNTYDISVKGPSSTFPSDVMAFVDFNQNGVFDDEGESFYLGRIMPANPANANTITASISVQSDAILGETKMRIIKNTNVAALNDVDAANSITSACADDLRSGQVEDYGINIIEGNLSLVEVKERNDIKVYPNPVNDILYIQADAAVKSYQIYNADGRFMRSGKRQQVNVESLPKGVYFIKVVLADNSTKQFKFIKN